MCISSLVRFVAEKSQNTEKSIKNKKVQKSMKYTRIKIREETFGRQLQTTESIILLTNITKSESTSVKERVREGGRERDYVSTHD